MLTKDSTLLINELSNNLNGYTNEIYIRKIFNYLKKHKYEYDTPILEFDRGVISKNIYLSQ